jgi:hypothetical protein
MVCWLCFGGDELFHLFGKGKFVKKLTSKWDKTASGCDSYEISDGESRLVFQLAPLIEEQFGLTPQRAKPVVHLDEVFIEYDNFYLDWDIWSGFSVFAKSEEGNQVVREVAAYIETLLDELES